MAKIMWVLITHRNMPPFRIFLHRNTWVLLADFVKCTKITLTRITSYTPNVAWRLGSAWSYLNAPQTP